MEGVMSLGADLAPDERRRTDQRGVEAGGKRRSRRSGRPSSSQLIWQPLEGDSVPASMTPPRPARGEGVDMWGEGDGKKKGRRESGRDRERERERDKGDTVSRAEYDSLCQTMLSLVEEFRSYRKSVDAKLDRMHSEVTHSVRHVGKQLKQQRSEYASGLVEMGSIKESVRSLRENIPQQVMLTMEHIQKSVSCATLTPNPVTSNADLLALIKDNPTLSAPCRSLPVLSGRDDPASPEMTVTPQTLVVKGGRERESGRESGKDAAKIPCFKGVSKRERQRERQRERLDEECHHALSEVESVTDDEGYGDTAKPPKVPHIPSLAIGTGGSKREREREREREGRSSGAEGATTGGETEGSSSGTRMVRRGPPPLSFSTTLCHGGISLHRHNRACERQGGGDPGWRAVLVGKGWTEGVHSITFRVDRCQSGIMLGVCDPSAGLENIHRTPLGWALYSGGNRCTGNKGYRYTDEFGEGSEITVIVSIPKRSVAFGVDGRYRGTAFRSLPACVCPYVEMWDKGDRVTITPTSAKMKG
ncbi:hypothetical protein KIPB_000231 [Kipferlia bialata]|uniref:SPRY domain-containing protein n=1 Tax=Kipferlia bialata TaxID=797122 RepID=A0A9K3CNH1_9EUKA|nr:hypothetical protein KIPB_000231 [Kipferlia bialata]|eukprot:g231.t1